MNLYKKPLSSSQYCHTEEEAVTNIHKVFYQKRLYLTSVPLKSGRVIN